MPGTPGVSPVLGMAIVTAACGVLLWGVSTWKRQRQPPPELTRKAVHVGMGLIALSMPWLFAERWPVLVLCAGMAAALLLLKRFARHSDLGSAMHDVNRVSRGDLYFAVSVGVLWVLAAGDWLLFVVPMLVLTLGDATAALVGARYGQMRFDGRATGKSVEGSVALFVVTFLSAQIPLVLSARVGAMEGILIAATMGVIVALLEAVAWRGLDNVFVPIGAFMLLQTWLSLDASAMGWRLAIALAVLGVVLVARASTTLRDTALAGAALFGYVAGTVGGWRWVMAPLVVFLAYSRLFPPSPSGDAREHELNVVAGVVMPAVAWLFVARLFDRPDALVPYTATFVAQLAMMGVVYESAHAPGGGRVHLLRVVLKGALVVLPAMALHRPWPAVPLAAVLALAAAVLASVAINRGTSGVTADLDAESQWMRQALWAFVASMATLPALM